MSAQVNGLWGRARAVASATLALLGSRLQLAGTELEEQHLLFVELLAWALGALFCLAMGVVLATGLVIMLMWDGPRLAALAFMAGGFVVLGGTLGWVWWRKLQAKPPLLAATVAELKRDAAALGEWRS